MSQTTRERHSGRRPQRCVGRRRQQGAALVIGLILLLILTLLAVTGMNTATTELVMAGNEQYRNNASHAASTGIEEAIPGIGAVPTTLGAGPVKVGATPVPGSDPAAAVVDKYSTSTQYVGEETGLPQSSANKFVGLHYVITSTGTSARSAKDVQSQGVLVVAPAGSSGGDFGKTGKGLGP
jgi:type IV pilus assembly protein PilX